MIKKAKSLQFNLLTTGLVMVLLAARINHYLFSIDLELTD